MFNISNEVEETVWINFSKDEKYLIRWLSPEKINQFSNNDKITNIDGIVDYIVKDWDGIFETKDGKDKKLECNLEMKKLVFDKSPSRWGFVFQKAMDYRTFFDIENHEKN